MEINREKFIDALHDLRYRYEWLHRRNIKFKTLKNEIRRVGRSVGIKLTDEELGRIDPDLKPDEVTPQ